MDMRVAINIEFLDEEACRSWWLERLHPAGPCCPGCGVSLIGVQAETFKIGGKVHCRDCGKWFTSRTGTPVQNLSADWRQLVLLASLTSMSRRTIEIAEACNISDDTVRRYQRRIEGLS